MINLFSLKTNFKKNSLLFFLSIGIVCLSLLATFIYLFYSLKVKHFSSIVFTLSLISFLISIFIVIGNKTISKIATLLFVISMATTFGLYLDNRLDMFVTMAVGGYGMFESGAILWIVILILSLMFISFIFGIIISFNMYKKNETIKENNKKILVNKIVKISVPVLLVILMVVNVCVCTNYINANTIKPEAPITLASIEVENPPTKNSYFEGQCFNSNGMTLKANYSNNQSRKVENYTIDKEGIPLTMADNKIKISAMDMETTYEATVVESPVVATFKSENQKIELYENGNVKITKGTEVTTGSWSNNGKNLIVKIGEKEYLGSENEDYEFVLNYEEEVLKDADHFIYSDFQLTGKSGNTNLSLKLKEDGTANFSQGNLNGTWVKNGYDISLELVDGEENTYTAKSYCNGEKYIMKITIGDNNYWVNTEYEEIKPKLPEPVFTAIAVTTAPTQITYYAGQYFNNGGMVLTGTTAEGTQEIINYKTDKDTTPFVMGDTTVTVKYKELTATINITVTESPICATFNGTECKVELWENGLAKGTKGEDVENGTWTVSGKTVKITLGENNYSCTKAGDQSLSFNYKDEVVKASQHLVETYLVFEGAPLEGGDSKTVTLLGNGTTKFSLNNWSGKWEEKGYDLNITLNNVSYVARCAGNQWILIIPLKDGKKTTTYVLKVKQHPYAQ